MYRNITKRIIDWSSAIVLLVVLSPVFLLIALILIMVNKGEVLFIQDRPGLHGRIIKLYKFKTMNDRREDGNLLPDSLRLTFFGRLLRKTSLDEIPQLLSIIKGDLSFVGPRPLLKEYLGLYDPEQLRRHEVTPGITGWAQVNGRNTISWKEKFGYDVWYVDNQSLLLDLKIVLLTIYKVLKGEGISQEGQATVEAFNGNN